MANELNANFLIRGIRNGMDYDYEENIALINEELSNLDTIYVRSGKYGAISSSMIVEFLSYGKDVSNLIPKEIYDVLIKGHGIEKVEEDFWKSRLVLIPISTINEKRKL